MIEPSSLPGDPAELHLRICYDDELWDTPQAETLERWSVAVLHRRRTHNRGQGPAAASLLPKARDDKSGKPLAGSTVNIGTGDKTVLTLTTGPNGTATAQLPVTSRTGTSFWGKQIKAPAGYDLYKPSRTFTAKPGDSVTVTITNAKTASTTLKINPSEKPSDNPTQDKPGKDGNASSPSASASDVPVARQAASSTSAPTPEGTLAHTGADATPWLLGSTSLLIAAGGGAVLAARRRRPDGDVSED